MFHRVIEFGHALHPPIKLGRTENTPPGVSGAGNIPALPVGGAFPQARKTPLLADHLSGMADGIRRHLANSHFLFTRAVFIVPL